MMQLSRFYTSWLRHSGFTRGLASAAFLMVGLSFAPAFSQEYFALPIDEKAVAARGAAQQYLRSPADAAAKAKFNEYFKNYYFPSMTRTEPDKLGQLAKMREDLFKQWMFKTSSEAVQQELTNLAYSEMAKVVISPAHPAVRYNAVLIIGQLDEKYSPDGRTPPKPLPKATGPLVAIVNSATGKEAKFPPSVILGAIVGLERRAHLKQSLTPEEISSISSALMKFVAQDTPVQEMDSEAYSWMRLRAAETLASFGSPGDKSSVHAAIIKLATTGKSLDDRCAAAGLLEKIEYKDVKLDDAGTAEPLFALARDVATAEDKRAQEFQDQQVGGGVGVQQPVFRPSVESFNPSGLPPETYPRRTILARLVDLRNGLKKVKASLPEASQKKVDAVVAALNPAITAAANKDVVELTLVNNMRTMADAVLKAVPPAEKAAADKAKEDSAF